MTKKVLFWFLRGKKVIYLKKGKKEVKSEDRSHIARRKWGNLLCQLVTKILRSTSIH